MADPEHFDRPHRPDRLRFLPPRPDARGSRATPGHAAGSGGLGAADRRRPGGRLADHLHDARQPGGRRRRRPLAHRLERGDGDAVADELHRGQRRRGVPRRDCPAARGLRVPEAPAERVSRHGRRRATADAPARPSSSAAGPPIAASRRPSARRSARTSARWSSASAAGAATPRPSWSLDRSMKMYARVRTLDETLAMLAGYAGSPVSAGE